MDATAQLTAKLPKRSRALIWSLMVLAAIMVLGFMLFRANNLTRGEVAAGYMARVVCSCRYAGGRDMPSCLTDAEPGMEIVKVSEDVAARTITARVPLIASRTARYNPAVDGVETGCTLVE